MKKMLFTLMLSLAVLVVLAPLSFANPPGFDDKEIRIGMFGPQTGPAAPWGSVARGSALLMNIVNEEGRYPWPENQVLRARRQYNPAQTKTVVKELVERQGIFAFVGGVGAACGLAVKDYLLQNKIIWVGPATAIKEYVEPNNPYLFANYPLFDDEASILTKYVVEKLKMKKIGFLYQHDAYGKNAAGWRQDEDWPNTRWIGGGNTRGAHGEGPVLPDPEAEEFGRRGGPDVR